MSSKFEKELINKDIAQVYKMEIEISEGRTTDSALLQLDEKVALSSIEFQPEQREFFLSILKNADSDLVFGSLTHNM